MEFGHLIFVAFLCLALSKIDASQSAKDYWDSVFPNTSVPEPLQDLVFPPKKSNLPIKVNEEKQYWTLFFEQDLHPGKMMRLGLHNHSDTKPSTRTTSQPFGAWLQAKISEKYSLDEVCGKPSGKGEHKFCAASLESMMGFAISKLGKNIRVVSSSFDENHDRYSVVEVNKVGEKAVMCHRLNFEKVVFYCHQVNATTSYMVPLVASDGAKAKALTICHHDTRGMDPVVLYQVLRVKPGTVPVCHFVGNKTLAWVPNLGTKESCSA